MLYLIPFAGAIPSAWTLWKGEKGERQKISGRSLKITLTWLILYTLLWTGSTFTGDSTELRLLYLNGLLTTGYVLLSLGMMLRIWKK